MITPPVSVHLTIVYPQPLVVLAFGRFYVMLCYVTDRVGAAGPSLGDKRLDNYICERAVFFYQARHLIGR